MSYLMRVSEGLPVPLGRGGSVLSSAGVLVTRDKPLAFVSPEDATSGVLAELASMGNAIP